MGTTMKNSSSRQRILVVDDTPSNISILGETLSGSYEIVVATCGRDAIATASSLPPPDLILLDIMMPGMDGYQVCALLKESALTRHIPVIFVTAKDEVADEAKGFALGAVDYITKPISTAIVQARVATHLALYDQNRALEEKVRRRTRELANTQDVTIRSLAILAEYRDNETGGHIIRTQHYVRILAEALQDHPRFVTLLGEGEYIDLLFKSTPLHDIGKVAIRDEILLKPGRLTTEEFEEMKRHTLYGREALLKAEEALEEPITPSFLGIAREMAYSHHEKYDGSGYPQGIAGDAIPLPGRLMAVADVYDALVSKRIYKPPFSHAKAYRIITEGDGRVEPAHFDPDVLAAFRNRVEHFRKLASQFADSEEERQALFVDEESGA
jgi:putative two-component system response regulator